MQVCSLQAPTTLLMTTRNKKLNEHDFILHHVVANGNFMLHICQEMKKDNDKQKHTSRYADFMNFWISECGNGASAFCTHWLI